GFEFGIQRFEENAAVLPLIFPAFELLAGVLLDSETRGFIHSAKPLDEQNLILTRAVGMEAEEVEAALRDARLHGAALHVGYKKIFGEAHALGRRRPAFGFRPHLFTQAARRRAEAVNRQMRAERLDRDWLDMLT